MAYSDSRRFQFIALDHTSVGSPGVNQARQKAGKITAILRRRMDSSKRVIKAMCDLTRAEGHGFQGGWISP